MREKRRRRKKKQDENIMSASAMQGGHNNSEVIASTANFCYVSYFNIIAYNVDNLLYICDLVVNLHILIDMPNLRHTVAMKIRI